MADSIKVGGKVVSRREFVASAIASGRDNMNDWLRKFGGARGDVFVNTAKSYSDGQVADIMWSFFCICNSPRRGEWRPATARQGV